jgi:hypothetical protein
VKFKYNDYQNSADLRHIDDSAFDPWQAYSCCDRLENDVGCSLKK